MALRSPRHLGTWNWGKGEGSMWGWGPCLRGQAEGRGQRRVRALGAFQALALTFPRPLWP